MRPVACFGEMLLRFSPGDGLGLAASPSYIVGVAGAEANVAIGVASLGHPARMITVLPDNALGERALQALAAHGVDATRCLRAPGRIGTFYLESPLGGRDDGFFYDRGGSAFASAEPDAIDWEEALSGASWLHVSGVTLALGERAVVAMREAVAAAAWLNVPISFDCNFRPTLWQGRQSEAALLLREFASSARLLFASDRDARFLLANGGGSEVATELLLAYRNVQIVASTQRCEQDGVPMLGAKVATREGRHQVDPVPIEPFVERVGAGDAFAAGILFGLRQDWDIPAIAAFAHRLCLLKHAVPGDFSPINSAEVMAALEHRPHPAE